MIPRANFMIYRRIINGFPGFFPLNWMITGNEIVLQGRNIQEDILSERAVWDKIKEIMEFAY